MKIMDWIQGKNLNLETMEIEERDDVVVIPAWQFALMIKRYHDTRHAMLSYFVLVVVMFVFWMWTFYLL